jgi:hypothetical protein
MKRALYHELTLEKTGAGLAYTNPPPLSPGGAPPPWGPLATEVQAQQEAQQPHGHDRDRAPQHPTSCYCHAPYYCDTRHCDSMLYKCKANYYWVINDFTESRDVFFWRVVA